MQLTFLPKKFVGVANYTNNEKTKLEKLKTVLKECAKKSILNSGLNMRKNRSFIYSELFIIKKKIILNPLLLGPKFPKILSAVNYGKNEIFLFFAHCNQEENLRKDVKKHFHIENYEDTEVIKLISIIIEIINIIEEYFYIII